MCRTRRFLSCRFPVWRSFQHDAHLNMDAVQQLPAYQQQEFMKHLEQMQLKDSLTWVLYEMRVALSRQLVLACIHVLANNATCFFGPFLTQQSPLTHPQHVQQFGREMLWRVCQLLSIKNSRQIGDFLLGKLCRKIHQDDPESRIEICGTSSHATKESCWCSSSHARITGQWMSRHWRQEVYVVGAFP